MSIAHIVAICMAVIVGFILIRMGMEFNELIQQTFEPDNLQR